MIRSSDLKSNEMLIGIMFICLLVTIICSAMSINNFDLYIKYQQIKFESEKFSLLIQCQIDEIISREIINSSENLPWTIVESKFIISIIHPLNNTKQTFEESSVPISLYNTVVSPFIFFL